MHVIGKHLTNAKCNKSQPHSLKIIDIVNDNGNFLSHTEINDKLDLQSSKWNWMLLITAIPKTWKTKIANDTGIQLLRDKLNAKNAYIIINNTAKDISLANSKHIYHKLIMNEICPPSAINKWIETYPFLEVCDWNTLFTHHIKLQKNLSYSPSSINYLTESLILMINSLHGESKKLIYVNTVMK